MLRRHLRFTQIALFVRTSSSLSLMLTKQRHVKALMNDPPPRTLNALMSSSKTIATDSDAKHFLCRTLKFDHTSVNAEFIDTLTLAAHSIREKGTALVFFGTISHFLGRMHHQRRERLISSDFCIAFMRLQTFADNTNSTTQFLEAMKILCHSANLRKELGKHDVFPHDYHRLLYFIERKDLLHTWLRPLEMKAFICRDVEFQQHTTMFLDEKWKDAMIKTASMIQNPGTAIAYINTLESLQYSQLLLEAYTAIPFMKIAERIFETYPNIVPIARAYLCTMSQFVFAQATKRCLTLEITHNRPILQATILLLKFINEHKGNVSQSIINAALHFGLLNSRDLTTFVEQYEAELRYLFRMAGTIENSHRAMGTFWKAVHSTLLAQQQQQQNDQRFLAHFAGCDYILALALVPVENNKGILQFSKALHWLVKDESFLRNFMTIEYRSMLIKLCENAFRKCDLALRWLAYVLDRCIFMDCQQNGNEAFSTPAIGGIVIRLLGHSSTNRETVAIIAMRSVRALFYEGKDCIKNQLCQSVEFVESLVMLLKVHAESIEFAKLALRATSNIFEYFEFMEEGSSPDTLKEIIKQLIEKHDLENADNVCKLICSNLLKSGVLQQ